MENELLKAYAEVDKVLSFMENKYVEKIPSKMREMFKDEKLEGYNPIIDPKIPLDEQNLQKRTLAILAMLNLNYWCESEKEKQELIFLYAENDRKREEELREKYNPDNIFKNKNNSSENIQDNISTETAIVEYQEKNFIQKLFDKIKHLFRRK